MGPPRAMPIWKQVLRYLWTHGVHFMLLIPGAVLYTIVHEAGHAAAVIAQGGRVTSFRWLPSAGDMGRVEYVFAYGQNRSQVLISTAPYLLAAGLCLLALVLSFRRRPYPFWAASSIFVWLFLAPLADTASASVSYMMGHANDLAHAFGPPTASLSGALVACGLLAAVLGYRLQRALYRERSLGPAAYAVLGLLPTMGLLLLAFI